MKIGIAGAGILGRLLAFTLHNSGHTVSLYDQLDSFEKSNCSMTASGLLAPVTELEKSERIIHDLGQEALTSYWPEIINVINAGIYYRQVGSLVVSHPNDKVELQRLITVIEKKLGMSFKNNSPYRKINKNEISQLEPELSTFTEAHYFPTEGQLDNQAVMSALNTFLKHKIEFQMNASISDIHVNEITIHDKAKKYDMVFDCRGMGAKSVMTELHAVRGEVIWLHAPDVNITRPIRLMHPRYGLYVVPRPEHKYIIGASEIYSEDYSNISVRTTLELLTAVYYLHPAFAEARIIKTMTHCRPAYANLLPKIKCTQHSVIVNGLYRHGFLIAPALIADIMRWLDKGKAAIKYPELWEGI